MDEVHQPQINTNDFGSSSTPFTKIEIKKIIGLFVLHRLSTSPQFFLKFKPQVKDTISENNSFCCTFGARAEMRLTKFKRHFTECNPEISVLLKKEYPNWKDQEFLSRLKKANQWTWIPVKDFNRIIFTQN